MSSFLSSLRLALVLLTLCYSTHAAPTHHLTIGVQGNTPTLIVTSSEIGITPEIMNLTTKQQSANYTAKDTNKDLQWIAFKNSNKTKLNRDRSLLNKKEKLPYLVKTTDKETVAAKAAKEEQSESYFKKDQKAAITESSDYKMPNTTLKTSINNDIELKILTITMAGNNSQEKVINTVPLQPPIDTSTLPYLKQQQPEQKYDNFQTPLLKYNSTTVSNLQSMDDISTTTNYNDVINTTITSMYLTQTKIKTETENKSNNKNGDNSKRENENGNVSHVQDPAVTIKNENILLMTIEKKAALTTTTVSPDSVEEATVTLTNNTNGTTSQQILSLSSLKMTMATTENIVDDNDNKSNNNNKKRPEEEYTTISSPTETVDDEESRHKFDTTEKYKKIALKTMTTTTPTAYVKNALENEMKQYLDTNLNMEMVTETTPLQIQQPGITLETVSQKYEMSSPTPTPDISSESSTTTEKVLKLIDLEQHILKTIDDLKQPSLLMADQHDNGHDGLKSIKKKQLIDKHYVEALLHNKQDVHVKEKAKDEKYLPITTTTSTKTQKGILMPIKHGYLGPILMEEKTFHVIHHGNSNKMARNLHLSEADSHLRHGNFVELKAKAEVTELEQISTPSTIKMEQVTQKDNVPTITSSALPDNHIILTANSSIEENVLNKDQQTINHNFNSQSPTITEISQSVNKNISSLVAVPQKSTTVLSTTVFQVIDSIATKTPMVQANTMFTSEDKENSLKVAAADKQTESKISDIQIEVYDSTIDSIIASTNFKDKGKKPHDETSMGKTTKPPVAFVQQERFTQYVIDRTDTSTQEPINYSTIQVGLGKPEPAAIEIHINVSESFGNDSEDLEFSYPQTEFNNNNNNERLGMRDESYDDTKVNENIKLKIPTNANVKDPRNDEILVVEITDTVNLTDASSKGKTKTVDELFITDIKDHYTSPPPPPPPPPYQSNFDRDSDTIFYISNTEVKVGESLPNTSNEERKLKLESQFFPANYMVSTHSSINTPDESHPYPAPHHHYEEDILLSSSRNRADFLKIYRNRDEPSPPLDVTYVGESIMEVEQSPNSVISTTHAPDQEPNAGAMAQTDVVIQPAILPEISIGVPVIGELPPQIELKEIDFMPNEAQLHHSGIYDDNDNNNINNNDIDENIINDGNNNNNNYYHDVDNGSRNNNNPRVDESSIQYGGDLIDESADGGFDGVEGSYPFGNPAVIAATESKSHIPVFMKKLRKQQQQPNHVADYAHLYVNYGVNNMRKDELSADIKDSAEVLLVGGGGVSGSVNSNEQNLTSFKEFLNKVNLNNSTIPSMNMNSTQSERMSNATAFSIMEDVNDLEDKSTENIINLISLAVGLFIVILPVVVTCSMFWALRYLYKKYHSNIMDSGRYAAQAETKAPADENGLEKGEFLHEPSSSPIHSDKGVIQKYPDTSNKPSTITDNIVKFSSEKSCHLETTSTTTTTTITKATIMTTIPAKTTETAIKTNETVRLSLDLPAPSLCPCLPSTVISTDNIHTVHVDDDNDVEMPGPNGSITKMTMENNLLIVETEERNDISRVARETKMDYNKDGVFVVEVARGIDSKTIPESPITDGGEKVLSMFETKQNNGEVGGYKVSTEKIFFNNEKVQIHSPPSENIEEGPRSLHQIEEVEEPINSPHLNDYKDGGDDDVSVNLGYKCNTGLSQSDLSINSSSDSNKGYSYGNQALYVVENGYSTNPPTNNVLKCDIKDIRDDDPNPGNDHYIKHSPDKKEGGDDNEDIVENIEKPYEGDSGTSSRESPAQKLSDKCKEHKDGVTVVENKENLLEREDNGNEKESLIKTQIPVEIEVHVTSYPDNESDEIIEHALDSQEAYPAAVKNTYDIKNNISPESHTQKVMEYLPLEEKTPVIESSIPIDNEDKSDNLYIKNETPIEISLPADKEENKCENIDAEVASDILSIEVKESLQSSLPLVKEKNIPVGANEAITESPNIDTNEPLEKITRKEAVLLEASDCKRNTNDSKSVQAKERETDILTCQTLDKLPDPEVDVLPKNVTESETEVALNGCAIPGDISLQINEVSDEIKPEEKINRIKPDTVNGLLDELESSLITNGFKKAEGDKPESVNDIAMIETKPLTNGFTILPDLVAELKSGCLQNGYTENDRFIESLEDMENGYDSIMSLPEPPPTTDEQQNNDLSYQQMDSLPPPPPPEIFNLKDLSPHSLINGNVDSPQKEESTNFYNTLPPPPSTTLNVTTSPARSTTTNGKVHASPLTPPASPPVQFGNNLHVGLCSQPIAVDVNGS